MDTPALMWRPGVKIKGCGSALIKHLLADLINSSKHFTFSGVIATEISNISSIDQKLRFIKEFNNPNKELKLTGYAYCNYVSIGNISAYGYATIYGMYDNNNGKAISGQMAITSSGEVLKRSYINGSWTTWKNVDDYDTNLKRMPLDGTVEFNQFTITKNTSGKYVLNFYKIS